MGSIARSLGHVFLIDDDAVLREYIAGLLAYSGYEVHSWENATKFLAGIPAVAPVVLVTDMRMPGMSGCDLHAELHRRGLSIPVIYISGEATVPQTVRALKQGAHDFLLKPFGRDELLAAVATAIGRDQETRRSSAAKARFSDSLSALSPRQRQVADLLLLGYGNREIVEALGISLPTAKQYKSEVMQKLGVRTLSQLMGMREGRGDVEQKTAAR